MKYTVLDYLEATANKYPNKIAFADTTNRITWQELVNSAKEKSVIISKYFSAGSAVPIMIEKSVKTVEYFFAALYAGCFYSYFDATFPDSRLNSMVDTLKARYIIADSKYEKKLLNINVEPLFYKKLEGEKGDFSQERRKNSIDTDAVYANFTSGSTGTPKAVVVSHRSVIDFISCFTELFDINENDNIANQAPFDFDVSVKDIFSSIKVGATLVIIPKSYFSNPTVLLDYICDNKVTTLTWAVSALCLVTTFHGLKYKVPKSVNKILFSGEVMPIKHLNKWMEALPNTMFVNVYGPTEITCNCTYHIIDRKRNYDDKIPVGKPFPNERVILLDKEDNVITDIDTVGEICVSGTPLALGYYNNIEQTNKNFVQNPSIKNYREIMYRTGDLGYYDKNGDLIFNGRKDFQIKYLGHRIELEEIDKAIMEQDEVIRCCTIFEEEKSKLYGFYIGNIEKKDLVIRLKEVLPVFMIPTIVVKMDEFPITKNGKIDRKKLLEIYKEGKK